MGLFLSGQITCTQWLIQGASNTLCTLRARNTHVFEHKSAILHALYVRLDAAFPVASTVAVGQLKTLYCISRTYWVCNHHNRLNRLGLPSKTK